MTITRRGFLGKAAVGGLAVAVAPALGASRADAAVRKKRLTGADLDTNSRWHVAGTDLGIPYVLENGSIGYLFGDTFNTPFPEGPPLPNDWRSPVMLRSNIHPGAPEGVVFDSAAKVAGDGRAPEVMHNGHHGPGIDGLWEVTVIPNDGISFPETGRQLISYMSIENWDVVGPQGPNWRSPMRAWRTRTTATTSSAPTSSGGTTPTTPTRSRCGRCNGTATSCTCSPSPRAGNTAR